MHYAPASDSRKGIQSSKQKNLSKFFLEGDDLA